VTESKIAALPTIASADPGAELMGKLVRRLSLGFVPLTPHMVQTGEVAGLAITPALSELLLEFAALLWRPIRKKDQK
jgi:hypothetical protein